VGPWPSGLAVGEPRLGSLPPGGFDVTPLLVAGAILLIARAAFRIRLTWPFAVLVVLGAPPLVGIADRIGFPVTAVLVIGALMLVDRMRVRPAGPES